MLRVLIIFRTFTQSTGHQHPHMQDAIDNYRALLEDMHLPPDQIARKLASLDLKTQ